VIGVNKGPMHFANLPSDCLHLITAWGHREPMSHTAQALQVPYK